MGKVVLTAERPTLEQVRHWPATVDIPPACSALGISRSHGYELVRRGDFPARVITLSGRYVVVTDDLIRALSAPANA